ncbi:hypothetical protein [Nostoc sp.]|uniref:hypothetical protein n=1 Tax=Nostoc sp. TaxID=1180 RepID=UPI002FFAA1D2
MRYELRSNTTPVATTDSAGGKRVCKRREPPFGFTSRLQRWIHRNALAPLQSLISFKNQIVIVYLLI